MANRKDSKGRNLRTGEYYNAKTHIYQFRKMIDGERVTITDSDLAELRKRENELLVSLDKGQTMKNRNSNMSLNAYFDFWLNTYAPNKIKCSTITQYKKLYDSYVRDQLGNHKIKKLTKVDFQILFNELSDKGLSTSTQGSLRAALNGALECALDDDLIVKNPVRNINLGEKNTKTKDSVPDDQLNLFMKYAKESVCPDDYAIFVTLFNTGVRVSELGALTWNDIDFSSDTIQINKTLVFLDKKTYGVTIAVGSPKSKKSVRTICMNKVTRTALLEHRMRSVKHPEYSIPIVNNRGEIIGNCSDFVFMTNQNRVMTAWTVRERIKRLVDLINKDSEKKDSETKGSEKEGSDTVKVKMFSPHCTRHTFTSKAYESGADMKIVSEMLGHNSTSITLDIYTHLSQKKQEEKKEVVGSISVG